MASLLPVLIMALFKEKQCCFGSESVKGIVVVFGLQQSLQHGRGGGPRVIGGERGQVEFQLQLSARGLRIRWEVACMRSLCTVAFPAAYKVLGNATDPSFVVRKA